jgi:serine/threonine-protein kinase
VTTPPALPDDFSRFAAALSGQYELEREIGRGGMGIVYLARDLKLDRRVAIKTLPAHLAGDPVIRERFVREARTAAALTHQNVVPIHRADELGGQVFFVMGYIDGESLAQRIKEQGRLDPREVVRELTDVADALAYAHAHGVIHRDVKAENILVERSTGRALVTDFGIARLAEAAPLTATGQVLGTVYYLSPEQVSGDTVDARSDVYSLGVVGYFALAGRFPFDAPLASAVLIAHVTKNPPPLHTVAADTPRALADLVDRCLAKDPGERFQSCDDLRNALAAVAGAVEEEMRGRAAPPSASPAPSLVSDTEAQSIWRRAADLQAMTGVSSRPAEVVGPRDAARDAARTSGYRLSDVRDAAVEAGIPARYVERALVEHGLSGPDRTGVATVVDRSKRPHRLAGVSTQIEFEVVVDGEMPENDYDLFVDIIRRAIGEAGQMSTVGRSFAWHAAQPGVRRNLHISVVPRGGKTTIHVSENLRSMAGGLFGGIMGGAGGGTAGVWISIAAATHNPALGIGLWLAAIGGTYTLARGILGVVSRKRAATLRELAEALAAQARESIDAAKEKLPAPRR